MQQSTSFNIPYPPFPFSEYVDQVYQGQIRYELREPGQVRNHDETLIIKTIDSFFMVDHKVQYIGSVINHTILFLENHRATCPNPQPCETEKGVNSILYFLYKQLNDLNIVVDFSSFSHEDIVTYNNFLDEIIIAVTANANLNEQIDNEKIMQKLNELAVDLNHLKSEFGGGKKRWGRLFLGTIKEYAAEKGLDFIVAIVFNLIKQKFPFLTGYINFLK